MMNKILFLMFLFVSSFAYAVEIPEGSHFWVTYNPRLGGQGDRMMAIRLSKKISNLGFPTRVFSHPELVRLTSSEVVPAGLISVPDQESIALPAFIADVPYQVVREAGYQPYPRTLETGLSSTAIGMLFDDEMIYRFRQSIEEKDEANHQTYLEVSANTRAWLSPLLEVDLNPEKDALTSALGQTAIFFSYGHTDKSRYYFEQTAREYARASEKKVVLIEPNSSVKGRSTEEVSSKLIKVRTPLIHHSDFQSLLSLSTYALVTGDRSLEEAISAGVPFTYDILYHKENLARQLKGIFARTPLQRLVWVNYFQSDGSPATESDGSEPWRVRKIAQDLLELDRAEVNETFMKIQDEYNLNPARVRMLLEKLLAKKTFRFDPNKGFEPGVEYLFDLNQILELQVGWDGKLTSKENMQKYGINDDHYFKVEAEADRYLLTLVRNVPPESERKVRCNVCGKRPAAIKHCGKCKSAFYCGQSCQKGDWPQHKKGCKAPGLSSAEGLKKDE